MERDWLRFAERLLAAEWLSAAGRANLVICVLMAGFATAYHVVEAVHGLVLAAVGRSAEDSAALGNLVIGAPVVVMVLCLLIIAFTLKPARDAGMDDPDWDDF